MCACACVRVRVSRSARHQLSLCSLPLRSRPVFAVLGSSTVPLLILLALPSLVSICFTRRGLIHVGYSSQKRNLVSLLELEGPVRKDHRFILQASPSGLSLAPQIRHCAGSHECRSRIPRDTQRSPIVRVFPRARPSPLLAPLVSPLHLFP